MRKIFLSVFALLLSSIGFSQTITPSVFNAGGGSYHDPFSYLSYIEYSIGELALINTDASADGSITLYQGVLQPCTDKPGITPASEDFAASDYKIFPNPTTGKFEVDFFVKDNGTLYLELTDMLGQVLETRSVHYYGCCLIESYDISNLPAGIYFVVATLRPDAVTDINKSPQVRHSGLKVFKAR
jgi:Secretion system C-terminal sorting domain